MRNKALNGTNFYDIWVKYNVDIFKMVKSDQKRRHHHLMCFSITIYCITLQNKIKIYQYMYRYRYGWCSFNER